MDTMFPIWFFLFWTIGAPLLWAFFDHLRMEEETRTGSDHPMPMTDAKLDLAWSEA